MSTDLPHPAESLQARLTRERQEEQEGRTFTLALPGYAGLVVQYHSLPWKAERGMASRVIKQSRDVATRELYVAADSLIASCDSVEMRPAADEHPEVKAEAEQFNGEGYKLDKRLAEYLGAHKPGEQEITPREALFLIIPVQRKLMAHYGRLLEEQGVVGEEIDEEQLGEPVAVS